MYVVSDSESERSRNFFCRRDRPDLRSSMLTENERNFWKSDVCELQIEFQRPCRGLSPGKGFAPNLRIRDMACRDVQAILYSTKLGQIVANMLGWYSKNNFTKMKISRDPVDGFCWKAVRFKIKACSFRFWKREVLENFSREDWTRLRSGTWP